MNKTLAKISSKRVPLCEKRSVSLLLFGSFVSVITALGPAAQAKSEFPERPITLIVPYSGGGGTDVVARLVAKRMGETLNKPIVVENKPGAGGGIGAGFVARAAPNGYTLLLGTVSTQAINPSLYKKLSYSPDKDFDPVAMLVKVPQVIVVNSKLPYRNLSELIDAMRSSKDKINFGSQGIGGIGHLMGEMLNRQAKVETVHVPYKGAAPALQDLVAGNIQVLYDTPPALLPHIKSGAIRALAVADDQRIAQLDDVPTTTEAGFPQLKASTWNAIFAPSGTPPDVVEKLNAAANTALKDPKLKEQLEAMSATPITWSADELGKFEQGESAKWAEIVRTSGVSLD